MADKFSNFQDKIGVFRLVWSALDSRLETFWPLWPDFFFKSGGGTTVAAFGRLDWRGAGGAQK